jgi:DeoR family glycerol-3-phosphate regulon repressor
MNITQADETARANAPALPARERIDAILGLVSAQGYQTTEQLAALFGVTAQTIRRDVNTLCDRGLCRRRHGGIEVLPDGENIAYSTRRTLSQDAKRRIARCVAGMVPDGASLFFGIGTTPEQCARAMLDHKHLKVMTNNLNVAMLLSRQPTNQLVIAGGRLRNLDGDVIAGEAHGFFRRFAVDIGIYGVGGVAEDGSLLDFSHDEVLMRTELSQHCRERFLVLDHSKFGRGATVKGGHITHAHRVITDRPVPDATAAMLAAAGVMLAVAPESVLPHH